MTTLSSYTDSDLVDLLIEGNKCAFEEIYLRYWYTMYQHARKMLRDEEQAKDVVHDLFAQLLIQPDHLTEQPSLSAYLYRSIRNKVINQFHKTANRSKYEASLVDFYNRGNRETEELIWGRDLENHVQLTIAELPARMQKIFVLSRQDNLSYREIAQEVNVSEETVRTQIKRALKILRSKLQFISLLIIFTIPF